MANLDEITRRIVLDHAKPSNALDRAAKEAIKSHLEARSAIETQAYRAAMEAFNQTSLFDR